MARYAHFWGCYIPNRLPHMEKATRAVLAALGVEVLDLDGFTCCPEKSMIKNAGHDDWLAIAARNLDIAEEAGVAPPPLRSFGATSCSRSRASWRRRCCPAPRTSCCAR